MFTGIVEEVGEIVEVRPDADVGVLTVQADREPGGVGVRHAREGRAAPEDGRGR